MWKGGSPYAKAPAITQRCPQLYVASHLGVWAGAEGQPVPLKDERAEAGEPADDATLADLRRAATGRPKPLATSLDGASSIERVNRPYM